MTCPNKNTKEYKQLEERVGSVVAHSLFNKFNEDYDAINKYLDSQYKVVHELSNDMKNIFGGDSTTTVKEALEKIAKEDNKVTKLLANKLLRYISNDTKIVQSSLEEMQKIKNDSELDIGGLYNPATNTIHIRPDQRTAILLHEILHAFTVQQLKSNSQAKRDLDAIYKSLKKSNPELSSEYAMSDLDEFLVGIFTDPKFIAKLSNIPSQTNKQLSVWDDIMNVLSEVLTKLGFSKQKAKSILEESMNAAIRVIEDAKFNADSNADEAFDLSELEAFASLAPEEVAYYESQTMTKQQEETMKAVLSGQDMGLNEKGTFYVKKENGKDKKGSKQYIRVSDKLNNKFNGDDEKYEINREAGNDVDSILSDVILGKSLSEVRDTPRIDEDVREDIYNYFTELIEELTADGSIIMTQQIFSNDASAVAGATDIILIKPDGKVDIYDLKTSTTSTVGDVVKNEGTPNEYTVNYELGYKGEKSKKDKHTEQQSMYKRLAELQGIQVDDLHIVPIHIEIKKGKVVSINPEPIIELPYNERLVTGLIPDDISKAMSANDLVSPEKIALEKIRERIDKLLAHWKDKEKSDVSTVLDKLSELSEKLNTAKELEGIEAFIKDAEGIVKSFETTMRRIKNNPTSKASITSLGNINTFMDTLDVLEEVQNLLYREASAKEKKEIEEWEEGLRAAIAEGREGQYLHSKGERPGVKTKIDDAVTKLRHLKQDYLTYGRKAYAELLFSSIPENVLEETKRIKNKLLDKNPNDARAASMITSVRDMERELATSSSDIDGWSRWMGSAAGDENAIIALTSLMIKNKLEPVTEQLIHDEAELGKILSDYLKETGKSRDDVAKLNEDIIETVELARKKDSNGNWYTPTQKQFVDRTDWKKYGQAQSKMYKEVGERFEESSKEYRKAVNEWYENNTHVKANYKDIIEDRRQNLTPYEFSQWNKANFFNNVPTGELVEPNAEYVSEKWKKLYDSNGKPISAAGRYHQGMLNKYNEFINQLDYKDRIKLTSRGYKLPSVPKSDWERTFQDKNVKGVIKDKFKVTAKDTNFNQNKKVLDAHGREVKEIPKFYLQNMEADEVSSDVFESMLMASKNWRYYKAKSEIQAEIQLVRDLVDSQTVNKTDTLGNAIEDIKSRILGTKAKKDVNNLKDKLNNHLDVVFYGSEDERANFKLFGKNVEGGKLIQNMMFMSSAISLTGNIISGISNATLGNLTNLIEAGAKEYLVPKALAKAGAKYTMSVGHMALDVNKLTGKSLETQLSKLFDFDQAYIEHVGSNQSGSRTKQVMDTSTLGFVNNGAEHQIYTTAGFAFLESIKWIDGKFQNRKDYLYGKEGSELDKAKKEFDESKESLLDAYELDSKGVIKLKDKYNLSQKDRTGFKNKLHEMNKYNHGNYSKHDKNALQRTWYGKLALFFRKHIQPGLAKRFGRERINYALGGSTEGIYVGTGRACINFIKDLSAEMKTVGFAEAWNRTNLTEQERANMRRTVAEGAALIFTIMLVTMLGDDDEEKTWAENLLLLQARRLQSELGFYSNPLEAIRVIKSPTVAMGTVEATAKFVNGLLFEWGDDEYYARDTGYWKKGDSKDLARFSKLIPGWKAFIAASTPEEQIKTFNKLTF